jgi:hypothetical protein
VELLVIASAIGIWCFDNWSNLVEKGIGWSQSAVEVLSLSKRPEYIEKAGSWTKSAIEALVIVSAIGLVEALKSTRNPANSARGLGF